MKRCPKCRRDYTDETLNFCLDDGSELLDGPSVSDEHATAILGQRASSSGSISTPTEKETQVYSSGSLSGEIRRHKFGAGAIGLIAIVILAGFAYGMYRLFEKTPPAAVTPRQNNVETRRLTGDGKTTQAAISPDGKVLVYVKLDGERESLWIKQILTDSSVPVQTSEQITSFNSLTFSPDGNFVYFNAEGKTAGPPAVYRVPTFGGIPNKVLTNAYQISFSKDGSKIAFGRSDQVTTETSIHIANVDGSNERKLSSRTGKQFFNALPSFSPDGKLVAVSTGDDDVLPAPDEGVVLISIDDGREIELGKMKWTALTSVVWHPSGDSVIVIGSDSDVLPGQVWEVAYPSGDARRLTNNLNGYGGLSITADGNAIVTMERYTRSAVWVSPDLDPAKAKRIMPDSGDTWGLSWTTDGRIVYGSDLSGDAELWIMNSDGTSPQQLTRDRVFKGFPDVSTDGRYIVYGSDKGMTRINIDGSDPKQLTNKGFGQDNPDISPDDKWVLYSAWVDGAQRILRVPLAGGEAMQLTNVQSTEPRYSADGLYFACFEINEKTQELDRLGIYPADGGEAVKKFDMPVGLNITRGPIWTPDGKSITVLISRGEKVDLWAQPVDGGPLKQLTDFNAPVVARRDYSRDGKRIALVRGEGFRNAVMISGYR
jgi:Tol biopolymer transport system component